MKDPVHSGLTTYAQEGLAEKDNDNHSAWIVAVCGRATKLEFFHSLGQGGGSCCNCTSCAYQQANVGMLPCECRYDQKSTTSDIDAQYGLPGNASTNSLTQGHL